MNGNAMDLSDEEYSAYVDAMSDIWAEDLKLYGSQEQAKAIEATEAGC